MPQEIVDVVVLSRNADPLRSDVQAALDAQERVRIRLHRVLGAPRASDRHRWETIARARNQAKALGRHGWFMFLDDDVVLARNCVRHLLDALQSSCWLGAVAANYADRESLHSNHVAMGATLFRRTVLDRIQFRWESGKCECQCCNDDLRSQRLGIQYVKRAKALHRQHAEQGREARRDSIQGLGDLSRPCHILTTFNRSHCRGFRERFLPSLRRSGNLEPVTAVAYGLRASERRMLVRQTGVRVISKSDEGVSPALSRLWDFPPVIKDLPDNALVAYWDAADILFQNRLTPLWDQVENHAGKVLFVPELTQGIRHPLAREWTKTIYDVVERKRVYQLLCENPYVNGGFAAGTPHALLTYFAESKEIRLGRTLRGTKDWGDQTAMNVYRHSHPDRCELLGDDWNYVMGTRQQNEHYVDERFAIRRSRDGKLIPVVHGAGGILGLFWLMTKDRLLVG